MLLEGSCHCGAVRFKVTSHTPYPYMWCYCSICRKTAGGGGYAINIMGDAESLAIEGEEHLSVYRSRQNDRGHYDGDGLSDGRRNFCRHCGSALWLFSPEYPQWIYPFASAVDTPLPDTPERVEIMLDSRPSWCELPDGANDTHFRGYPKEGIEDWHRARGLYGKP